MVKGAGVVALTMFDLRRRGKVDRVGMCGVNVRYMNIQYFSPVIPVLLFSTVVKTNNN